MSGELLPQILNEPGIAVGGVPVAPSQFASVGVGIGNESAGAKAVEFLKGCEAQLPAGKKVMCAATAPSIKRR